MSEERVSQNQKGIEIAACFLLLALAVAFGWVLLPALAAQRLPNNAAAPSLDNALGYPEPIAPLETIQERPLLFDKLISPFTAESERQRALRSQRDSEYAQRVDVELNRTRINFLLFGHGESYEPPFEKVVLIGSHTIASYDTNRKAVDLVSITHDTRAPEIERFLMARGQQDIRPIKIDQAYHIGGHGREGFELQRQVLESATGLAIDFQVVFGDDAIVDLIDDVFGGINVSVPKTFDVNGFYFRGKYYPDDEFREGIERMGGLRAIQFIKTVVADSSPNPLDRELEHNARKPLVIAGAIEGVKENALNPLFWKRAIDFLNRAIETGQIAYDFDAVSLLTRNIGGLVLNLARSPFDQTEMQAMRGVGRKVYIVDQEHGDGAVRWVKGDDNPLTRYDLGRGFYLDPNMEVPLGGNPYSQDLIRYYWQPVRERVKHLITTDR